MDWYYVRGEERVGPLNEADFESLVASGEISKDTLVWHEGMGEWQEYSRLHGAKGSSDVAEVQAFVSGSEVCVECGNLYSPNDMVRYGESFVCAECKPVFFQRLQEGALLPGAMEYAGFWIRFGAKFIDLVLLGVVNGAVQMVMGMIVGGAGSMTGSEEIAFFIVIVLSSLFSLFFGAVYTTFFIGRFAATPGKMACGLKVVRADGDKVSYMRALGRHFAEMLSAIILYIGYLMAAFDEEKRSLHDRICDTRVIRK